MTILIGILTFLEVIVCLLLSLLVLMQRPRQEGLGATFGSGMTDQMFGAQTTNVLQKGTVYFGIALFILTFLLAVLTARMDEHNKSSSASLVDSADLKPKPTATTPAAPAPPANANKEAAPTPAAPAKTEPAKANDKKPVDIKPTPAPAAAKPADAKPAAPKPAETKPTPSPAATPAAKPAPTPAPAAATKPADSTPPASTPAPAPESTTPEKK
jgi:preprotein translocase subunit SecG